MNEMHKIIYDSKKIIWGDNKVDLILHTWTFNLQMFSYFDSQCCEKLLTKPSLTCAQAISSKARESHSLFFCFVNKNNWKEWTTNARERGVNLHKMCTAEICQLKQVLCMHNICGERS
jgi:hypothetical protein